MFGRVKNQERSTMKMLFAITILLFSCVCYSEEGAGKICLNIPERGVEAVKIATSCKKGDIIRVNKIHIATLCDFNSAIVNYNGADQYVCVYLGKNREPREGTN